MSTNDCPGANPVNRDVLAAACWAEHADGSLIFVEGTEGGNVIYSMFDMSRDPPMEYRDMMPEDGFKKMFSWKPGEATGTGTNEKWIWHDKTPMPWQRIIKKGITDGTRLPSADATMTAAARVAESLKLRGANISTEFSHRMDDVRQRAGGIMSKLKNAINELRK